MKAMLLRRMVSLEETDAPLECDEVQMPEPAAGEVLVRVNVCGVCHTELDEIEGRAAPSRWPIILGHEVVGRVTELGRGVTKLVMTRNLAFFHYSTNREPPVFQA